MDCLQKQMNVICGRTISVLRSMGTAKKRGYQVIVHTESEVSRSFAETGKEHGREHLK